MKHRRLVHQPGVVGRPGKCLLPQRRWSFFIAERARVFGDGHRDMAISRVHLPPAFDAEQGFGECCSGLLAFASPVQTPPAISPDDVFRSTERKRLLESGCGTAVIPAL